MSCNHLSDCPRCRDEIESLEIKLEQATARVADLLLQLSNAGIEVTDSPQDSTEQGGTK